MLPSGIFCTSKSGREFLIDFTAKSASAPTRKAQSVLFCLFHSFGIGAFPIVTASVVLLAGTACVFGLFQSDGIGAFPIITALAVLLAGTACVFGLFQSDGIGALPITAAFAGGGLSVVE